MAPIDHRALAMGCFNAAWDLLDLPARTPEQDAELIATTYASLYHWMKAPECTPDNLSIGLWQVSRAWVVTGNASEAERVARQAIAASSGLRAFLQGYGEEALARALPPGPERDAAIGRARAWLAQVEDPEEKAFLEADLATLEAG